MRWKPYIWPTCWNGAWVMPWVAFLHTPNLSHTVPACPCLMSLSCRRLCCPSVLSRPRFFPSAFLSCLPQLYPDSLSLSLYFCSCLTPFSSPSWRLNWAFEPATPTQMDKRDLDLTAEPPISLAAKGTLGWTQPALAWLGGFALKLS